MALQVWKKIGELEILAKRFGKWLGIQKFLNPETGREVEFALFGQKDWSVVLAVTEDGRVIVTREYKQGRNAIGDELPAGTAEFAGESPKAVMHRELREETGYEASEVVYLGAYFIATRSSPTRFHAFLATGCHKMWRAKLDENEDIEARLVSLDEWVAMIQRGEITEPSAVVATFRSLPHLGYEINPIDRTSAQ